jgi:hypothetical protein
VAHATLSSKDSPGCSLVLGHWYRYRYGSRVVAEESLCFRIVIVRYRPVDVYTVNVESSSCGVHASGIKGFARCFMSGRWGNKADVNLCDDCLTFESLTLTWAVL